MQESFPIVTAPAKEYISPEEFYVFCISDSSETILNKSCLHPYPLDDRFEPLSVNNSSLNQSSREDFSYPDGSWLQKSNLLTIQIAIKDFDDFKIFDKNDCAKRDVNIDWPPNTTGKFGRQQRQSNSKTNAPIQIDMLNNPPRKLSDEYCVSLADWNASVFKTISVDQTDKPKYWAELADFLATDQAGLNNGQSVKVHGGLVFC